MICKECQTCWFLFVCCKLRNAMGHKRVSKTHGSPFVESHYMFYANNRFLLHLSMRSISLVQGHLFLGKKSVCFSNYVPVDTTNVVVPVDTKMYKLTAIQSFAVSAEGYSYKETISVGQHELV